MNDALSPAEVAGYAAVMKSAALLQRGGDRALTEHRGLTRVQFEILSVLTAEPAGLRMFDLAERLVHSRSGLTYQVTQLEKKGLVTRERGDVNERAVLARITPEGDSVRAELYKGHLELVRKHFTSVLDADELAVITSALTRVMESFGGDESH